MRFVGAFSKTLLLLVLCKDVLGTVFLNLC